MDICKEYRKKIIPCNIKLNPAKRRKYDRSQVQRNMEGRKFIKDGGDNISFGKLKQL